MFVRVLNKLHFQHYAMEQWINETHNNGICTKVPPPENIYVIVSMHFELICKIGRLTDFASLGQCMARILNVSAEKLSIVCVSNERVQERLGKDELASAAHVSFKSIKLEPTDPLYLLANTKRYVSV